MALSTPTKGEAASPASSGARSPLATGEPSTFKQSAASQRVPRPKKTGNDLEDDAALALWHTQVEQIDEIIRDPSHVMPLWIKVQDRRRKATATTHGNELLPSTIDQRC